MARRKNTKRIDPRYFLNETAYKDLLQEAAGETPEQVAARIGSIPPEFQRGVLQDLQNMAQGSIEMADYYPHVDDLVAFAEQVLSLLRGDISEVFGAYNGTMAGSGKAANLGAVAGRAHPTKDDPDSVIQGGAQEFFMDLGLSEKVSIVLSQNIASPDLATVMDLIGKIDTAQEELQDAV